jgi:integrase
VWSGDSRDGEDGSRSLESPTLSDAIERFIDRKKREGRKQSTLDTYRGIWRRFRRSAGAERLSELSASDVSAFVHDESVSQATRRKRYRHVCAVLRSADRDELTSGVPTPRYDEKLPTPIRPGEFERIIGAVKAEYREKRREHHIRRGSLVWTIPAFRFLFNSGLRAGELAALRWRDIDRERSLVLVREQKNGRAETGPPCRRRKNRSASRSLPERAGDVRLSDAARIDNGSQRIGVRPSAVAPILIRS